MNSSAPDRLAGRRVVLLGVGHTNAHVVRMWGMTPLPDTELICLSNSFRATYSGMLPAVLAGQLPPQDMEIDLVRLCSSVGARLITNRVVGLDADRQRIVFEDRPSIPFDVLSVGIGSVPAVGCVSLESEAVVKIKPMQTFLQRLSIAVQGAHEGAGGRALKVVVVGGGVAGVEVAFCIPEFIRSTCGTAPELHLLTRSCEILPGVSSGMRRLTLNELQRRQVPVATGVTVTSVAEGRIQTAEGTALEADLIIWATGAAPPPLLSELGLPVDEAGFLMTDDTLRSVAGKPIFAVGDSGSIFSNPLPKAGVFAVRQGPVLWENVQRQLNRQPLIPYRPQRSFLKLLNTGDGRAIGEWKGISFSGTWVMKLKNRIDSRFMKMFRVDAAPMSSGDHEMQCRGCGCKLGGDVLRSALLDREQDADDDSAIQIELDDAAIIPVSGGQIIASTDFFTSPFDDPFLSGRVAALHSASDIVAMGGKAIAALANVVVPEGAADAQQQSLQELLAGARREFHQLGAQIVGGHTIVGDRWQVGFSVVGESPTKDCLRKGGLQAGDQLYLTKPLGIGVLMAAHMRSRCTAASFEKLLETMLQPQHQFADIARNLNINAGTDVTGFGLAGHLMEMLIASQVSATLQLSRIPLLPGVREVINDGIESSLAPGNRDCERDIKSEASVTAALEYRVLFDPQTCGGLLFGVNKSTAEEFEHAVQRAGLPAPYWIGSVVEPVGNRFQISVFG